MQKVCKLPKIKKGLNRLKPLLDLREPDWIRTNGLLLRRQLLYPTELPVRNCAKIMYFSLSFTLILPL
jgi:hypothetical protein